MTREGGPHFLMALQIAMVEDTQLRYTAKCEETVPADENRIALKEMMNPIIFPICLGDVQNIKSSRWRTL